MQQIAVSRGHHHRIVLSACPVHAVAVNIGQVKIYITSGSKSGVGIKIHIIVCTGNATSWSSAAGE